MTIAQMRAQIKALAQQGAPNIADLIEHDRQIVFLTHSVQVCHAQRVPSRLLKCPTRSRCSHGRVAQGHELAAVRKRDRLVKLTAPARFAL
jgi:hypothetical protein